MLDMNDFRYFATIVEHGSFTGAGRALGLPTSTLSTRIKQLEERLSLVLLRRSSRHFSLTEAGLEFYRHAAATVERANEAEAAMKCRVAEPLGVVRYTTSTSLAQCAMPEMVHSFLTRYPTVSLVQYPVDHLVDIISENYDVAIRTHAGPLPDSRLIQRPLAKVPWILVAAPSYLACKGEPELPSEIEHHETLYFGKQSSQPKWCITNSESGEIQQLDLSPRFLGACIDTIRHMAVRALGIAALPAYACRKELENGSLVALMPGWNAADTTVSALFPNRTGMSAAVRAFVDHLSLSFSDAVRYPWDKIASGVRDTGTNLSSSERRTSRPQPAEQSA